MGRITLLAMAPSGETFLARDRAGLIWLFQPIGAGEPEVVDQSVVDRAVAHGGFDSIGRDFESWADVTLFLNERATLVVEEYGTDPAALDAEDVTTLLAVAKRWMADGQYDRARQTTLALLKLPAAKADPAVLDCLVAFLEELARPPALLHSEPKTDEQRAARERWGDIAA